MSVVVQWFVPHTVIFWHSTDLCNSSEFRFSYHGPAAIVCANISRFSWFRSLYRLVRDKKIALYRQRIQRAGHMFIVIIFWQFINRQILKKKTEWRAYYPYPVLYTINYLAKHCLRTRPPDTVVLRFECKFIVKNSEHSSNLGDGIR